MVIINKLESAFNCASRLFSFYNVWTNFQDNYIYIYIFMSVVTWSIFFQSYSPAVWVEKIYVVCSAAEKRLPCLVSGLSWNETVAIDFVFQSVLIY